MFIEMMAQASAAFYRLDRQIRLSEMGPALPGKLAAIEKARFYQMVFPGDVLTIETILKQRIGGLAKFEASIKSRNELVATSLLILVSPSERIPGTNLQQR